MKKQFFALIALTSFGFANIFAGSMGLAQGEQPDFAEATGTETNLKVDTNTDDDEETTTTDVTSAVPAKATVAAEEETGIGPKRFAAIQARFGGAAQPTAATAARPVTYEQVMGLERPAKPGWMLGRAARTVLAEREKRVAEPKETVQATPAGTPTYASGLEAGEFARRRAAFGEAATFRGADQPFGSTVSGRGSVAERARTKAIREAREAGQAS